MRVMALVVQRGVPAQITGRDFELLGEGFRLGTKQAVPGGGAVIT